MSKLFGGAKSPEPPPPPPPPVVMPTPDDAKVNDAKKRARIQASQRSGRASTILSSADSGAPETLG